ncbi:MAG TPA: hypothetical protein PLI70_02980 [Gemmatimonadales bacterium]|nr:hypothetical protein [Gemmatimonadales bacterium]HRZ09067.1 hypothetical protein [Gemmatimonadales bacterium]
MMKDAPDHLDADLILKLYDLRREESLRAAREKLTSEFWPKNAKEAVAIVAHEHPLNRTYRQVSTYWEMVYRMARHGIIHGDFLVENNGEGLLLYAKVEPYLAEIRAATSPRSFQNAEWVAKEVPMGRTIAEHMRARVKKTLGAK